MKYLYNGFTLFILVVLASCSSSRNYAQGNSDPANYSDNYPSQSSSITYQQFYDGLSPYGNWVNNQDYGYVWVPAVSNFRPYYSNGHWVYTTFGWTWVSDYNWGWAPFHYGRWMHDMAFGWMWVPGYEWGPAWVSWRGGGGYYGWAPLGPGMGINISIGSIPYNNWAFVPRSYINSRRVNNYYVNQSRNVTIINNTTIINNISSPGINRNNNVNRNRPAYNSGPSVADVEKSTRMKVRTFNVVESGKPQTAQINNNTIKVYRPAVEEEPANSADTKPSRVFNTQELEANRQKNITNKPAIPQQPVPVTRNNPNIRNPQKPRVFDDHLNENRNQPHASVKNQVSRPRANENNERSQGMKNDAGVNNARPATPANSPATIHSGAPARTFGNTEKPAINNRPASPAMNNNPAVRVPSRIPVRNFNNQGKLSTRNGINPPARINVPQATVPSKAPAGNSDNPGNRSINNRLDPPATNHNAPSNVPVRQPVRTFNNSQHP